MAVRWLNRLNAVNNNTVNAYSGVNSGAPKSIIKLDMEISFKTQVKAFPQTAQEKLRYNMVCD